MPQQTEISLPVARGVQIQNCNGRVAYIAAMGGVDAIYFATGVGRER